MNASFGRPDRALVIRNGYGKASGAQPRNAMGFERTAMTGTSPRRARNDGKPPR